MWESENKQFIGFRHGFVPVLAKQDLWCGEIEWAETLGFWKAWEGGSGRITYISKGSPNTVSHFFCLYFHQLNHVLCWWDAESTSCILIFIKEEFLLILLEWYNCPFTWTSGNCQCSTMLLVSSSDDSTWLGLINKNPSVTDLEVGKWGLTVPR